MILLHRVEAEDTVRLLHDFSKFATVRTFKPTFSHNKKSSFYMIATNIQPNSPECISAIHGWKKVWHTATFGTEEEYKTVVDQHELGVEALLEEFGAQLMRLGKMPWTIQANGLERAPFNREQARN